eukprot:gene7241-7454_t
MQLQQEADRLKDELAQAQTIVAAAQSKASAAEDHLAQLQGELQASEGKLAAAERQLSQTLDELTQTRQAVDAAASRDSTCKRSLQKVESQLSDTAAKLSDTSVELSQAAAKVSEQEAKVAQLKQMEKELLEHVSKLEKLKELEDALLPLWLSTKLEVAQASAQQTWQQIRDSDHFSQLLLKVKPYWEQAVEASKPAQKLAGEYWVKAVDVVKELPVEEHIKSAKKQLSNIEAELRAVLGQVIKSQPSLASLDDPVALQLLVYTVMGLPLLLFFIVLSCVVGGPRKSKAESAHAKAAGKKGSSAAPATASKKAVNVKGKSATAVAAGSKKGKAVRDGSDVLYTP